MNEAAARAIAALTARGLTIAVAESLTGGLLTAALTSVPGSSDVVLGGVVAYNTGIKSRVLGVPSTLLAERGAVDPQVAQQLALGVRTALAVGGRPADVGLATTGVAGPAEQDGQPVGTVFIGLAIGDRYWSGSLWLSGSRDDIRAQSVEEALAILLAALSE
jgi:nicotinamide-nucleotide amidase